MKSKLRIAGVEVVFSGLEIGRSVTFNGAGLILATAICRTSKNSYKGYLIMEHIAFDVSTQTMSAMVKYFQRIYDKYGTIPLEGDFRG